MVFIFCLFIILDVDSLYYKLGQKYKKPTFKKYPPYEISEGFFVYTYGLLNSTPLIIIHNKHYHNDYTTDILEITILSA
jgi:hypothetical protein